MSDIQDENHLIEERKKKLKELKKTAQIIQIPLEDQICLCL